MTIKINWGLKIALLYGGFVALIVILVAGSMTQDFDLVSKDYYAKEIAYQQQIDAGRNQSQLSAPVQVSASAGVVHIQFPPEFTDKQVLADIHFYSPVKSSLDRRFERSLNAGSVILDRAELNNVFYKCKISWISEGRTYYQETDVNLTR